MRKIANNDFEFIMCELKSVFKKKKVEKYLENHKLDGSNVVLEQLRKSKKLQVFPYDFVKKYSKNNCEIYKDGKYLYTIHKRKKLYFSLKYKSKYRAKRYYNNILIEQDIESPHRYMDKKEKYISNDTVVFDIGGAEGFFSLELVDIVKKIYIFECDKRWIEALKETFKDYSDKVEIISKYVSNINDENHVTIDEFIKSNSLENDKILVKMDIEGNEENALEGAKNNLKRINDIKWIICTYHTQSAEKNITEILKGYNIDYSKGYMLYYYDYDFDAPYLRKGVIRAFN